MPSSPDNNYLSSSADEEQALSSAQTPAEDSLHSLVSKHFIEYASYVIKERAIPDVDDGLKPVQRRILHAMSKIDDGRFNKVANVVGNTMQYHPHGDASINDALVVLANKKYFIEGQGNFGNILTGDPASAARYIECRLTALAKEVLFNKDITVFTDSYDGRNQEPVCLPCKVPALLMLGADGIAVGMRTQTFPHNFKELLSAQIAILEQKTFKVYPDFPQGGIMDVSEYEDGAGKIRLRARIEADGEKKLIIREIPATTTTESVIESISREVRRGRLKISSINDYTAENVEIEINLGRGVYAEETIKELYAYTNCELSIRSTLLVIRDNVPVEMTVTEVLERNTEKLLDILRRELELELAGQEDRFHDRSLVRIFIENRIYKRIEKCDSLAKIISETRKGLEAFRHLLRRDISDEDIDRLLQIHIRRISLFDLNRIAEELESILQQMEKTRFNLSHLTDYTIQKLRDLLEKYGPLFPRLTTIEDFESVDVREIARADLKVYHDKVNYFVGTQVKGSNKNDEPLICTEYDRLMLLKNDGTCKVIPVSEKEYVGPTKYLFLADKEQVYSIIYRDRQEGTWYVKRFQLGQYTLGREYQIIPANCLIEQLYTNSGVIVRLDLASSKRRSYNSITVEFETYQMRSREARGFKLTHYPVTGISVLNRGSVKAVESEEDKEPEPSAGSAAKDKAENNKIPEQKQAAPPATVEDSKAPVPEEKPEAAEKPAKAKKTAPATVEDSKAPVPEEKPEAAEKPAKAKKNLTIPASPENSAAEATILDTSAVTTPLKAPSIAAPAISAPRQKKDEEPETKASGSEAKQRQPEPAPQEKKSTPKELKKLIDEDTPFFLE